MCLPVHNTYLPRPFGEKRTPSFLYYEQERDDDTNLTDGVL